VLTGNWTALEAARRVAIMVEMIEAFILGFERIYIFFSRLKMHVFPFYFLD
jgi:hypothetical protein